VGHFPPNKVTSSLKDSIPCHIGGERLSGREEFLILKLFVFASIENSLA
jgi:hypothetical protein